MSAKLILLLGFFSVNFFFTKTILAHEFIWKLMFIKQSLEL